MSYLFKKMWDKSLKQKLRGIFCDLALTIYIDHEPLNEIYVPRLCHLFDHKSTSLTHPLILKRDPAQ